MKRAAWLVVVVAAIAAVGAALATCRRDAPENETPPRVPSDAPSQPPPTPAKPRHERASFESGPTTQTPVDVAAPEVDGFPALDVEVVDWDGEPCVNVVVTAGPSDKRPLPRSAGIRGWTNADGRCRLVLPRVVTWDVQATVAGIEFGALDVALPRAEPLRLTTPKLGEVSLHADADVVTVLASLGRRGGSMFFLYDLDDTRPSLIAHKSGTYICFADGATDARGCAPAGRESTLRVDRRFVVTPERFVPPAKVRVSLSGRRSVVLNFRVEATEPIQGWVIASIDLGPGEEPLRVVRPPSGKPTPSSAEAWLAATTTVVRWSGVGIGAEERPVPPDSEDPAEIDVALRLDGSPLPQSAPPGFVDPTPRHARVRVAAPAGATDGIQLLEHSNGDAGDGCDVVRADDVVACGVQNVDWIAAVKSDLVAGPVRVAADADAVNELTLAPGGRIDRVVEAKPPDALGRFTLSRKDGAAFVIDGENVVTEIDVLGEAKIGPIPPGDYVFVLRLSGIDVGEVSATVVAGATTKLVIPRIVPRR
jgi:hypothetical protein